MMSLDFMSAHSWHDIEQITSEFCKTRVHFVIADVSIIVNNISKIIGDDKNAKFEPCKIDGIAWGIDPLDWRPIIFQDANVSADFMCISNLEISQWMRFLYCLGCDLSCIPTAQVDDNFYVFCARLKFRSDFSDVYSTPVSCSERNFGLLIAFVAEAFDLNPQYDAERIWKGALLNSIQLQGADANAGGTKSEIIDNNVRLIKSLPLLRGYATIDDVWIAHQKFNGEWTPPFRRSVVGWGDAVTVLPYDPARDLVLLIEQFRAGPFLRGDTKPWCQSVVAGRMDRFERLEETARREAEEEAGISLGRLEQVAGYYSSPGLSKEYITCFVAEADLQEAGGQFGQKAENEDIRATVVSLDEALSNLFDGQIVVGHAYIAILALSHQREAIRRKWLTGE